jgi:hypothetical protein
MNEESPELTLIVGGFFSQHQIMTLQPRRWLAFFGPFADHLLGNGLASALVLFKQPIEWRFDVNDFNPGIVIGQAPIRRLLVLGLAK